MVAAPVPQALSAHRLPFWFVPALDHVGKDDFDIAVRLLWTEEPALRSLTDALEALLPDRWRLIACFHGEHSRIKCIGENRHGAKRYACSAGASPQGVSMP